MTLDLYIIGAWPRFLCFVLFRNVELLRLRTPQKRRWARAPLPQHALEGASKKKGVRTRIVPCAPLHENRGPPPFYRGLALGTRRTAGNKAVPYPQRERASRTCATGQKSGAISVA